MIPTILEKFSVSSTGIETVTSPACKANNYDSSGLNYFRFKMFNFKRVTTVVNCFNKFECLIVQEKKLV